jgi:hypothetical protein
MLNMRAVLGSDEKFGPLAQCLMINWAQLDRPRTYDLVIKRRLNSRSVPELKLRVFLR